MEIITTITGLIPDIMAIVGKLGLDLDLSKFSGIIDSATGLVTQIVALF